MTPEQLEQAACVGKNPDWFFPSEVPRGRAMSSQKHIDAWRRLCSQALAVCCSCRIKGACRDEAVAQADYQGVRGGLTPPEIVALVTKRDRRVGKKETHGREADYSHGCRCGACREAHMVYMQCWRAGRRSA